MNLPAITPAEVKRASLDWKSNGGRGISILVDDLHAQFTAEFTNAVLQSAYGALIEKINAIQAGPPIVIAES